MMDPNGSAGNSPLTDGDVSNKNDLNNARQSSNDEDEGPKKQGGAGGARVQQSQASQQQQGPRKGPVANNNATHTTWRPTTQAPPTGTGGQNAPQGGPARFAGKPRGPLIQAGGAAGPGPQGMNQGGGQAGAWPASATYYPRPPRFSQPMNMSNQQGNQVTLSHYPQQQSIPSAVQPGYANNRQMQMAMQQQSQGMQPNQGLMTPLDQLSKTNLYIRGLPPATTDRDLYQMCFMFGTINSTKAIIDKMTNQCKGYGFVDFENPQSADRGLKELTARGVQVQMAKVRSQQEQIQVSQDADPTNLYLANLSQYMVEQDLEAMLQPYGRVISTRVLRDAGHKSRGVGFARMENKEVCDKVIEVLNGKIIAGSQEPLVVKFADSGNRRRQQNRDRQGWNRLDQHMGMGGYDQMGGGQNGLGSMMTSIRYSVPQAQALAGYQQSWPPQYAILPQQMTQMMQGVDGPAAYSTMSQLAAQMSHLGISGYGNPSSYQYSYGPQQMYPPGLAQLQGGSAGQGEEQQQENMASVGHSNVNPPQNLTAVYGSYSQQK